MKKTGLMQKKNLKPFIYLTLALSICILPCCVLRGEYFRIITYPDKADVILRYTDTSNVVKNLTAGKTPLTLTLERFPVFDGKLHIFYIQKKNYQTEAVFFKYLESSNQHLLSLVLVNEQEKRDEDLSITAAQKEELLYNKQLQWTNEKRIAPSKETGVNPADYVFPLSLKWAYYVLTEITEEYTEETAGLTDLYFESYLDSLEAMEDPNNPGFDRDGYPLSTELGYSVAYGPDEVQIYEAGGYIYIYSVDTKHNIRRFYKLNPATFKLTKETGIEEVISWKGSYALVTGTGSNNSVYYDLRENKFLTETPPAQQAEKKINAAFTPEIKYNVAGKVLQLDFYKDTGKERIGSCIVELNFHEYNSEYDFSNGFIKFTHDYRYVILHYGSWTMGMYGGGSMDIEIAVVPVPEIREALLKIGLFFNYTE